MKVSWGGDTQIKCELRLIKEASKKRYEYYHLLSGVDFPIKTQDYIKKFFKKYPYNYIAIDSENCGLTYANDRVREYHILQNLIGRKETKLYDFLRKVQLLFIDFQKKMNVNRVSQFKFKYYKGSNWFSLRHDAIEYILKNKKIIHKFFFFSLCADELFIQTLLYNSYLKPTIINNDLRYIDWKRGNPYIFDENDFAELINSGDLFARKLTENNNLADMLFNKLN